MAVGSSEEHAELQRAVRRWTERHCPREVVRSALERPGPGVPALWPSLVAQGWLGLGLPEGAGGQGAGVLELAVVVEELGRALLPGPFLPTVLAVTVAGRAGGPQVHQALRPVLAGESGACLALGRPAVFDPGGATCSGAFEAVLGAGTAALALIPVAAAPTGTGVGGGGPTWWLVPLTAADGTPAPWATVTSRECLDPTRPAAALRLHQAPVEVGYRLDTGRLDPVQLARVLAAAELTGSARWCLEVAAEHARTRVQFGRTIGQFQGVKHRLANLAMAVEQMTAVVWDAASALDGVTGPDPASAGLAAAVAGALALDGGVRAARDAIQVLGAIGFSWEHDAHLHLRRAATLRQLLGGASDCRADAARWRLAGTRRHLRVQLDPEVAGPLRERLRPVVDEVASAPLEARHRLLGERGLLFPHWPAPYGRGAGPVEHLVIDELLAAADLARPAADSSVWALATLISHGTSEQEERWALATLRRQLQWCQLYSEPGAGSDLAALSTRAERVEGGWSLTGQKVWTSWGPTADLGICLARTGPAVPKHRHITYFVVDMHAPGVEVRPLREMTGEAGFSEVFLDAVFVPDDWVIGAVGEGWRLARSTLAFERVGRSSVTEGELAAIVAAVAAGVAADGRAAADGAMLDTLGRLVVDEASLSAMDDRATLRSVSGAEPGPESSVRKLMVAEHDQRVADLGLSVLAAEGVYTDGTSATWSRAFLHRPCLTISGGTAEIQRNLIGERLLGLARDRDPSDVRPTD